MPIFDDGVLEPVLRTCPLWLLGLLLVGASLLAREIGVVVYRRRALRRPTPEGGKSDADGHIISAIFGLLAFLVGFTYSIALDRYETRRGLVVHEANAISMTYLRADLFDEPGRTRLRTTLREYAHTRIVPMGVWSDHKEAQLQRGLALRTRLWDEARAALYPVRQTEQASYLLEAVNEMLSVGVQRQVAGQAHIPTRILLLLFLYLLISSGVLGYLARGDDSRRDVSAILLVLFSIVIVLIFDLDRPHAGAVTVPQQALEQLVAMLDKDAAR